MNTRSEVGNTKHEEQQISDGFNTERQPDEEAQPKIIVYTATADSEAASFSGGSG